VNVPAHLRIGSLEILGALAVFGFAVSRFGAAPRVRALQVVVKVTEPLARGGSREVAFEIDKAGPGVIGRSSDAAVGLLDPEVSREHAEISTVNGVAYLADLGSTNGTFLNGKKIDGARIELRAGDEIDVGTTRIAVLGVGPVDA
jgi:predicted component of type VI protein secretion system